MFINPLVHFPDVQAEILLGCEHKSTMWTRYIFLVVRLDVLMQRRFASLTSPTKCAHKVLVIQPQVPLVFLPRIPLNFLATTLAGHGHFVLHQLVLHQQEVRGVLLVTNIAHKLVH